MKRSIIIIIVLSILITTCICSSNYYLLSTSEKITKLLYEMKNNIQDENFSSALKLYEDNEDYIYSTLDNYAIFMNHVDIDSIAALTSEIYPLINQNEKQLCISKINSLIKSFAALRHSVTPSKETIL